jgi:acetyl/propionyl-CoA carboxylase alpha subunit
VAVGSRVEEGQQLAVVEAMKMQNVSALDEYLHIDMYRYRYRYT